jgi:pimeloyl-ACP methyl ester carboxylesterase
MFTLERFCHDSLELNVAVGPPAGVPLVMLHGVTRRWQTFRPVLPSLVGGWHVHALDFRGHGQSGRAPADRAQSGRAGADGAGEAYRVIDYVGDVVALVESLPQPAIVYGHSLGSMVAAAVAAATPEHVRAVVLEDPPMQTMGGRITESPLHSFFAALQQHAGSTRDVGAIAADLAEIVLRVPQTGEELRLGDLRDATTLRFMASSLRQLDPKVLVPIVDSRWLDGYETETTLRRIQCPTLLIQADVMAGGMLTDEDATQIESLAADVTRIKLSGVGHVVHWAETSRLLSLVLGFLESI